MIRRGGRKTHTTTNYATFSYRSPLVFYFFLWICVQNVPFYIVSLTAPYHLNYCALAIVFIILRVAVVDCMLSVLTVLGHGDMARDRDASSSISLVALSDAEGQGRMQSGKLSMQQHRWPQLS